MSVYDFKTFTSGEILSLKDAIDYYKDYDRLDLIIELLFNKNKKEELKKREFEKKEKEITVQKIPESLKYCDGDHCVLDLH